MPTCGRLWAELALAVELVFIRACVPTSAQSLGSFLFWQVPFYLTEFDQALDVLVGRFGSGVTTTGRLFVVDRMGITFTGDSGATLVLGSEVSASCSQAAKAS